MLIISESVSVAFARSVAVTVCKGLVYNIKPVNVKRPASVPVNVWSVGNVAGYGSLEDRPIVPT